jgi:hypothetical protein
MDNRKAKTHDDNFAARSTPRAPYHIPWPNFNLFSRERACAFSSRLAPK